MKKLVKEFGVAVLAFVVCIALLFYCMNSCTKGVTEAIEKEEAKYEQYLGEEFIMNGDTTTIIDYSWVTEKFTLSNGIEINVKLVTK